MAASGLPRAVDAIEAMFFDIRASRAVVFSATRNCCFDCRDAWPRI